MSDEKGKDEHLPSRPWQSIWTQLIMEANALWVQGHYDESWSCLVILSPSLPIQCQAETNEDYAKVKEQLKMVGSKIAAYSFYQKSIYRTRTRNSILDPAIPEVIRLVESSLERNGWISKETGYGGINPNKETKEF